jgi:glycosyltransferase involved in cell wall biosynthesis
MTHAGKIDVSNLPSPPCGKTGWPWTVQGTPLPLVCPNSVPWPWISIITPSYNQGRFIEETIRSVLLQGYPKLRYVVIDGGSTDGSVEVIKKYSPWLTYWVSEPDHGQSHAINKGFAQARGDVIGWLNSDDVLHKNSLSAVGAYLSENQNCDFLAGFSEFRDITGHDIVWRVDKLPRSLPELLEYPLGLYLAQPSVFLRRHVIDAVGPLNENLHYAMDLDLWLRIAEHHPIHVISQTLSWMRMHDGAKTVRDNANVYGEVETIFASFESRIPRSKYRSIVKGVRRGKAHTCLKSAFTSSHEFSRRRMLAAIFAALNHDKTVVFTRDCLAIALRLALPLSLRRFIFARP